MKREHRSKWITSLSVRASRCAPPCDLPPYLGGGWFVFEIQQLTIEEYLTWCSAMGFVTWKLMDSQGAVGGPFTMLSSAVPTRICGIILPGHPGTMPTVTPVAKGPPLTAPWMNVNPVAAARELVA